MGIVKYKNPKTGIIYCYESTPKWDPEKGQARPTRTYLGRWDEETQSIIPTNGRRGRRKKPDIPAEGNAPDDSSTELAVCREELARCREELEAVKKRKFKALKAVRRPQGYPVEHTQTHICSLSGIIRTDSPVRALAEKKNAV